MQHKILSGDAILKTCACINYYTHVMMYTHWTPYTDKYTDSTIIKLNLHYRQVKQITNREFTICHKCNINTNTSNSEQCKVS